MLPTLVLTAGIGSRLDPITRVVAKPAVPLGSSTLIEHVLQWLAQQGVGDVVLNLHHRPETIARVVGDGSHLGLAVRYSWEHPLLGSAGGPRHALPLLASEDFLIVNGDTLCNVDLPEMITEHRRSGADVTLAVVPNPAPDHYNGIIADADGRVTGFVPRGHATGSWHLVGVQVVRRSVFAGLLDGVRAETVAGIYRERLRTHPGSIRIHQTRSAFFDIGTPLDYLNTALHLASVESGRQGASAATGPEVRVPGGQSALVDTVVWPGATIDGDVELRSCVVVSGAKVPSGTRATEAVIVPASLREAGDTHAKVIGAVAIFPLERAVHSFGA